MFPVLFETASLRIRRLGVQVPNEKKADVEFVVVYSGRGIRDSLSEAIPDLKDDRDAIFKAVEMVVLGTAR
jgi:hypothetical protein